MKKNKIKKDYYTKKNIFIRVEPFDVDLFVYINYSDSKMLKHLKKVVKPNIYKKFIERYNFEKDDHTVGTMYQLAGGFCVQLSVEKNRFRSFVGTVVHEMTHVCHYLLRDRRIPLNEDTEEIYTYLTETLVEKVLKESY